MDNEQKSPDLSQMLAGVMSNPQAMAMFSSLLGDLGKAPPPKKEECHEEKHCLLPPAKNCAADNRKRLLEALRPFLSPERCQALDRILMIAEALAVLRSEKRL